MSEEHINLLCIVGSSPAVVTETVFALCCGIPAEEDDDEPVIVDTIEILTTAHGKRMLEPHLLSKLTEMAKDYPEAAHRIPTQAKFIEYIVFRDENGEALEDVRTAQANALMADMIHERVKALTNDEMPGLHASLAGGRKTMTYFLGSVMQFYARDHDVLSHVLTSIPAERCRHFFYPPPTPTPMSYRDGGGEVGFDASLQEVELHRVPFIRLRKFSTRLQGWPRNYMELIGRVQLGLLDTRVVVNARSGQIHVGDIELQLSPIQRALLLFMLLEKVRRRTPVPLNELTDSDSDRVDRLRRLYKDAVEPEHHEESFSPEPFFLVDAQLDDFIGARNSYQSHRSKINTRLRKQLPDSLMGLLEIDNVGPRGEAAYQPAIDVQDIQIIHGDRYL